jgi:signal peptidase II|uniref:Lipoprotein signal peptidase n=1 Tax=candidate division WOR-3 bacterium TaxID=2052148 RepID=A0A7C6AEX4_UNCW3
MQDSVSNAPRSKNIKYFLIPVFIALFLDQISKILIVNHLTPFGPPQEVIGSILRFNLAYNPYGVFSISFGPPYLYYLFHIIGIIIFTYLGIAQNSKFRVVLFGLIVGGALGNIVDRIRLKYVVDFIDMGIGNLRWFTYNLADAFVVVSAVLLIINELFYNRNKN